MGTPLSEARATRDWTAWSRSRPYTVGVEEEVMLLDPGDWSLAQRSDDVFPRLSDGLARHLSAETHQAAIELATDPHETIGAALAQLGALRARLHDELAALGLAVAGAGTHPFTQWHETRVSPSSRYQLILRTMAELARREPTFALHVHVGVADPEDAIRLMNRLRMHLPLLLALSANSPFWQGRATGLASTRTPVFGAFPRTGIPRHHSSYEDWVQSVDVLLRCGAFPEPTFLWWDVRPQPRLGTVEVRIMDVQSTLERTGALCALVQSLARLELEDDTAPSIVMTDEVLAENRFLATRDGIDAWLLDPAIDGMRPARHGLDELLHAVRPHADALGCRDELEAVPGLSASPSFRRQLDVAAGDAGLAGLVRALAAEFAAGG
jgi:glutamate---cysteine ligase / carboxylate-amine ligase